MSAKTKPTNELKLNRLLNAPVNVVWEAWNDPKQAALWWGPRGFTITTHSKDLRVGGHWSYTMHGPDGVDYPNKTIYYEVEKYKKLVYDHGGSDDRPPLFRVHVTFTEVKNKTLLEMTMAFASPEVATEMKKFIKKAGGDSTWDRLAEYVEESQTQKKIFVINRSFETDIETMYSMWTNPEHVAKWVPPTGFTMKYFSVDIKAGGNSFYEMTNGTNVTMYGRAHYLELTKPTRLVYTQQFCTKDGEISRHPLAPIWPETMLTTVTFTAEGPDVTRVTVEWETYGHVLSEELEAFVKARAGMTMGWTGSFDKLENYLEQFSS